MFTVKNGMTLDDKKEMVVICERKKQHDQDVP